MATVSKQIVPSIDEIRRINALRNGTTVPTATPEVPVVPVVNLVEENFQLRLRVKQLESLLGDAGKLGARPLSEVLAQYNVTPAEELLKIAQDPSTDKDQKIKIFTELLGYTTPKLKSLESKHTEERNITVTIKRFGKAESKALNAGVEKAITKHVAEQFPLPIKDVEVVHG